MARLARALPLSLSGARRLARLALPLPLLALPLLALPLLALPLLAGLVALLALATRVREVAPGVLQVRGRRGQVAVDLDLRAGGIERFAEAVQCRAGAGRVALREARGGVAERLPRGAVRLAGLALELGEPPSELVPLGLRHVVQPFAEVLEVVPRLLRVAARVRLGFVAARDDRDSDASDAAFACWPDRAGRTSSSTAPAPG
jgi:hypothetical protein